METIRLSGLVQGVLFDKDGTLFGFNSMWALWCDRVLAELSPDDETLRGKLGEAVGYDIRQREFTTGSLIVNAAAVSYTHLTLPTILRV